MRTLARAHKRPEALAEAMVDKDLKVFEYRNKTNGSRHFFSQREINDLSADEWERVRQVPEAGDGRFLTLSGERTVELGIADELASSRDELLAKRNVVEPPAVYRPGSVELTVEILNHWLITLILIVVGLVALYIELSAPGIGIGGAVAALCFGLFFWSRFLGGTSGWLELLLFVAGIGFLLLEFFVVPGFGITGVVGLCLVVGSLILASQEFVIPQTPSDRDRLAVSLTVVVASGFIFLGCAVVVTRHFGRLPLLNRLVLDAPTSSSAPATGTKASKFELWQAAVNVGDIGIADSPLRPSGKAQFGDVYVDVVADSSFVDLGKMVKVVQIHGNRVVVREIEKPPV
jgi:membrane-bound serine protease (ClpP class)